MKKNYLFLSLLIVIGCSDASISIKDSSYISPYQETIININQIEEISEEEFYVFFYLDSCQACRNTKMFFRKKREQMMLNVYFVDFKECDCHEKETQFNIGVTNPKEIKIKSVPTVLYFYKLVVLDEIIGYQNIIAYENFH